MRLPPLSRAAVVRLYLSGMCVLSSDLLLLWHGISQIGNAVD
jgi:hypothetical protein